MRIYTYNIEIRSPILAGSCRQGLILETDHGWGEAAPLPQFSLETLQEAFESIGSPKMTPSAEFALCSANKTFPSSFPSIPVCALVSTMAEATAAVESGFRVLKIKVKDAPIEDSLLFIRRIQSWPVQLRIDANRAWTLPQAMHLFHSLDPKGIEYIEEPTQNPLDLFALPPFPIALDETLRENDFERFLKLAHLRALVIKPTLLGSKLHPIVAWGQAHQKQLVFSSSFESAIGLLHIAHLQALYDPESAAGIDTHRAFLHNFLPFPTERGRLRTDLLPPLDRTWLCDPVF
jgi:o-succinylbenzoate synthase